MRNQGRCCTAVFPVLSVVSLLATAAASSSAAPLAPGNSPPRDLAWIALELDPTTTALGSRNLLVHIEPPSISHWGASGIVFQSDFPSWITDILSYRNREEDLDINIKLSPGLTVDYFFEKQRLGWHAGLLSFLWRYQVKRKGESTDFITHILMPRVGYRWFPFEETNIYLDPFVGLMTEYRISGDNQVDGARVKPTPIIPFATVHLGYHF